MITLHQTVHPDEDGTFELDETEIKSVEHPGFQRGSSTAAVITMNDGTEYSVDDTMPYIQKLIDSAE